MVLYSSPLRSRGASAKWPGAWVFGPTFEYSKWGRVTGPVQKLKNSIVCVSYSLFFSIFSDPKKKKESVCFRPDFDLIPSFVVKFIRVWYTNLLIH